MNKFLNNRLVVTIISLALMFGLYFVYFIFFRDILKPVMNDIPLPNPLKGSLLAIILGVPGVWFGYKYNAYGFRGKNK